jgi:EpsD family peptidyl-prolyl cis-trans isomerase
MEVKQTKVLTVSVIAIALAISMAGCSKGGDKPKATQVAAKVNGSEISVHQVNALLSKLQGVPPEAAAKVRQEVLGKLVDQQLAFDQAVEKKLDRNPDVMMAIESAKREIVARAYLEQIVSAQSKPSEDEARKYYSENPYLFSQRKVFNLQEMMLPKDPGVRQELRGQIAAGKSMEDLAGWLKTKGVQFRAAAGNKPAEQVQLDILPKLAALNAGQTSLIEGEQNDFVVRVISAQAAPVEESVARPRIMQFLQNVNAQKVVEAEMARLKASAKIEYLGDFANGAAAPVEAKPQAAAAAPETKPAGPNIEKGVAGLK